MRDRDQDSRAKARAVTWVFIPLGHFGTVKLTALCSKLFVRTLTSYHPKSTVTHIIKRMRVLNLCVFSFRIRSALCISNNATTLSAALWSKQVTCPYSSIYTAGPISNPTVLSIASSARSNSRCCARWRESPVYAPRLPPPCR